MSLFPLWVFSAIHSYVQPHFSFLSFLTIRLLMQPFQDIPWLVDSGFGFWREVSKFSQICDVKFPSQQQQITQNLPGKA